jgi:hypothetical protein
MLKKTPSSGAELGAAVELLFGAFCQLKGQDRNPTLKTKGA